jgi:hypothetical protein
LGAKHKFHDVLVSQAVKGGLMATYYIDVYKEEERDTNNNFALFKTGGYAHPQPCEQGVSHTLPSDQGPAPPASP